MNQTNNRIREGWKEWAFTHKQHLGRMCDRKEIEDYWISKIDELLKSQEHKLRDELVEKLEEYKLNYNPIGNDINKGRRLACDEILSLIKNN